MEECLSSSKIEAIWCEVRSDWTEPQRALAVNELLTIQLQGISLQSTSASPLSPFDPNARLPQYFDLLFVNEDGLCRVEHLL